MKILLVANTDWYLYNFRLALAENLRKIGNEVIFVSPLGKYTSKLEEKGFRCIQWKVDRQFTPPWRDLKAFFSLLQIYKTENPQLVHHHTIKPVLYGSIASKFAFLPPVVNSIAGRGYVFSSNDLAARLLRPIINYFYRLATNRLNCQWIFENEVDMDYFRGKNLFPNNRASLIESVGVDTQRFIPSDDPDGIPLIVYAGRMIKDKGIVVLVEAAKMLKNTREVRFALVGEPDEGNPQSINRDTLLDWDKDGVVEWWGWKSNMEAIYHAANIIVFPTMYGEGVPTTLLEAAASQRPIVASDIPGCRSAVKNGKTGFLVEPNNPQALVGALEKLIDNRELRIIMGTEGRKLIVQEFSVQKINYATIEVYNKLVSI